jgi:topoisomerase IA-like protein
MFTSLEMGREAELDKGGLSLRKNPLLVSIIDGCETLKALVEKQQLKPEDIAGARALIMLRTDKAGGAPGRRAARRAACAAARRRAHAAPQSARSNAPARAAPLPRRRSASASR